MAAEHPSDGWTGGVDDLLEVLRLAADPITVQDATGRLVYANEAAARQVGFETAAEFLEAPIAEVLGRYELVDETGAPLSFDSLPGRRALRGEREPQALVGFRIHGDPGVRWSVIQATPVLHGDELRFVINAFQDVTRLKQTEDRLRLLADAGAILGESHDYPSMLQRLAELVVPDLAEWCVVDVVEPTGIRRVAVAHPDTEMQETVAELQRRYPPNAQRGSGVATVIASGEPQIVAEVSDDMLAAAAVDDDHLRLLRNLNLRSAAIIPLSARGQVIGAITFAGGASGHVYGDADRPFLEDLARRAAVAIDNARLLHEANEAIRLRDEFLAMASHDMRTPLQAILANVELAERRALRLDATAGADRERLLANLDQAERTTRRLAHLVGDLLDVAMLRSGHTLPVDTAEVDLDELVRRVVAEHQSATDRHEITIAGSGGTIVSDPVRLERVVDNLVENAVKYSPDGGPVQVVLASDAAGAMISVSDRGVGIPAADIDAVFEPYHRASNVGAMPGIGLGLAGSRSVARQLGGDLTVESTEGDGSTFHVRLPTSPRRVEEGTPPAG